MAKLIKNKSVSFNVLDPYQKKLFDHCEQYENFSSYIKGLILRDMDGRIQSVQEEVKKEIIEEEVTDLMNGLI